MAYLSLRQFTKVYLLKFLYWFIYQKGLIRHYNFAMLK